MHKFHRNIIYFFLAFTLTACTLTTDITPPPGSQQQASPLAAQATVPSSIYPIIPPDLADGSIIYTQECAGCHGVTGLGDGPRAAKLSVPVASLGLSDFARQQTPAQWYSVVTKGNMESYMPAFDSLSDRQRWDVVAYAMSLSVPAELVSQGKSLYQQNCASCHGAEGKGNGPAAADLSTRPTNLSSQSLIARSSASDLYQAIYAGVPPEMPSYQAALNENELWALVGYLRSLAYVMPVQPVNAYPSPEINTSSTPTQSTYPISQAYPTQLPTEIPAMTATAQVTPTASVEGIVEVQLDNGSGGEVPSDVPVTLYGVEDMGLKTMQIPYSATLTTGVNGVYTFTNVLMPEGRVFMAATDYASGTYSSDVVTADPAAQNLKLRITVYDSTTDTSSLTTDKVHILFDLSDPQFAQVVEIFIISNTSTKAIVAPNPNGPVVTFPLPQGYSNLQFQDGVLGDRYLEVAQGFADTVTIVPGEGNYQVIFWYQLPYTRKLEFVQSLYLPTNAVVVMIPENGVKLASNLLEFAGTLNMQDTAYREYTGGSLLAGSSLEFTVSGRPKNASGSLLSSGTSQSLAIGLGVFGGALLLAGLWLYIRNQRKVAFQKAADGPDVIASLSDIGPSLEDEDTLMDAIISLDDQYHAGKLPEEAYLERRAVLKDKLRQISQE